jgi:hypothetical protein
MTLTTAGVLAGTPTTSGTSSFTIRATDANLCFSSQAYTLIISAGPQPPTCTVISIAPPTLPNGTQGVAYNQTIAGSNGTGPYALTVTAGSLPAGMTLTTAGVLAGTPTTSGTSSFTIRATDANLCFSSQAYTLIIVSSVPTLPQWGALLLAAGLLSLGYCRLRRRSTTAARPA